MLFSYKESLYIATKFDDVMRAKLINRWEELENKHREQVQAEQMQPQQSFLQDKLTVANWVMDSLRYSDAARLQLVSQIAEPYGVPVPDYVHAPNGASHAVSELLKERDVELSAIKFNKLALAAGLLEEKTRKGAHGKVHKYYSVTEKGLEYALNDIYKDVPGQTIPKWYDNKFVEVLEIIGYKPSSQGDMFASGETHQNNCSNIDI